MKIVHITESFASGTYIYLKNLCHFLIKNNYDFNITIIYSGNRDNFNTTQLLKDFDKTINFVNIDMSNTISLFKDLSSSYKISKKLRIIDPDIIHLHSSKASVIGRWASFLSFKKHKLYYTPHGYSFLREDISPKMQIALKHIEKYTQTIFGGTTIACGDTEFEIAKKLGKAKMVRNGINLSELQKK